MNPAGLTTAFRDGSNPRQLLYFARGRETSAVSAQGGQQARGKDRAGAGETAEQIVICMLAKQFRDLFLHPRNRFQDGAQLTSGGLDHRHRGGDHGQVSSQRLGQFDILQPLLDHVRFATAMRGIELTQFDWRSLLHFGQRGPALEKVAGLHRRQLPSPGQSLGIIEF